MGSPLAPLLADVYMCHVEEKLEGYENSDKIKLFLRYVDDTFIVFSGNEHDVEKLMKFINSLILLKFTSEMENNFELSFLDVKVMRNPSTNETTVYKKKIRTNQLVHWQSCQAKRYKIGLIRTLIYTALNICSSQMLLKEQCEVIKKRLIQNGYPVKLIRRKIKNTVEQHQKQQQRKIFSKA